MSDILVASHVAGRVRIKGQRLKGQKINQSICNELMDWDYVVSATGNRSAGCIVIRYNSKVCSMEKMEQSLDVRFPNENELQEADVAHLPYEGDLKDVVKSAEREGRRKSKIDTLARDLNRPAKIALLFTMIAMVPALRVSTGLHAAVGFAHLAFLLPHLVMHRKKISR